MAICQALSVLESPLLVRATKGLKNPPNYTHLSLSSSQEPKHTLNSEG